MLSTNQKHPLLYYLGLFNYPNDKNTMPIQYNTHIHTLGLITGIILEYA